MAVFLGLTYDGDSKLIKIKNKDNKYNSTNKTNINKNVKKQNKAPISTITVIIIRKLYILYF